MSQPLTERKFSLSEVCVLMVLEMNNLDTRGARQSWQDCGGPVEVFDRIVARLTEEGALMVHPRRAHIAQTGKLYEALGDYFNSLLLQAALAQEA